MRPKYYQCPTHEIVEYVESLLDLKNDTDLNIVLKRAKASGTPPLQITHADARHLEILARLVKPKKILEFGTLCGYSAVALSRALVKNGVLYTCEKSHHHAITASQTFHELKLNKKIILIEGDALNHFTALSANAPYDVIFIDSKKEDYPDFFEWCILHLKKGGLLLADNVFALGYIHKNASELSDKLSSIVAQMQKFNLMCVSDKRLRTTIFPTGEGLLAAVKL